jgi:hypothetical protein
MMYKLEFTWGTKSYGFIWFWWPQVEIIRKPRLIPKRTTVTVMWLRGQVEVGIYG